MSKKRDAVVIAAVVSALAIMWGVSEYLNTPLALPGSQTRLTEELYVRQLTPGSPIFGGWCLLAPGGTVRRADEVPPDVEGVYAWYVPRGETTPGECAAESLVKVGSNDLRRAQSGKTWLEDHHFLESNLRHILP